MKTSELLDARPLTCSCYEVEAALETQYTGCIYKQMPCVTVFISYISAAMFMSSSAVMLVVVVRFSVQDHLT